MRAIIFVGPWERCIKNDQCEYLSYIYKLRESFSNIKLIYSSFDPKGTVPDGVFDVVLNNSIEDAVNCNLGDKNLTANFYAKNSYNAVKSCDCNTIVRVRSDLQIADFFLLEKVFEVIEKSPNKLIIDFSELHRNLMPFNYSDFFVGGTKDNLIRLFEYPFFIPKISSISISPLTSFTIGRTRGIVTNEQVLWFNYFSYKNSSSIKIDSLRAFVSSYRFLNRNLLLVRREKLFAKDVKLNPPFISTIKKNLCPVELSLDVVLNLAIKEFILYYTYSFKRFLNKVLF